MSAPTQSPALAKPQSQDGPRVSSREVRPSLRCFAYAASRDRVIAECIDLDIAVEETSLNRAITSLNDAIDGYLSVANEGDLHGLVPRPSPLSHRLLYHYRAFVYRLLAGKQPGKWKQFEVGRPSLSY